ncbi:hypothetical protein ABEB36_010893 [Hypothenemus hampei]|uniref:VWFA domain-containing protein n=1 Tax=Hypothenemus hampei TaxID=57062 RepID=A0ABD1EDE6_HYPHA
MWLYRELTFLFFIQFLAARDYELLDTENSNEIIAKTITLLVEDSTENFENVLSFLTGKSVFENADLWLVTYNSTGVSTIWEKSMNNSKNFLEILNDFVKQSRPEAENSNKSLPLFAILQTARKIPQNAAIVIFTNAVVNEDSHLERTVLEVILKKNITVYTVTRNDSSDLLKNIREYSGGRKLDIQPKKFDNYIKIHEATPSKVSILVSRKNLKNITELSFPIDLNIKAIHITIKPSASTNGMLISPSGYKFSFSSKTKTNTIRYSQGSLFENDNGCFDMHLNFTTSGRPTTGTWNLKLENLMDTYNVTVFAFTNVSAKAADMLFFNHGIQVNNDNTKDMMKLGVTGAITHITDISLLDSDGETVLSNISYNGQEKYVAQNVDNVPDMENKEINVEIEKLDRKTPFYALIKGKDNEGNNFQRLNYILGKNDIYPVQTLTVEVGLGSELIINRNQRGQIYFEVTNLGTEASFVIFTCSDSQYILHRLSTYRKYLEPQESTVVTLYLLPRYGASEDEITFSAYGAGQVVKKKVEVIIGSQIVDEQIPEITYKFTSDCIEILLADCAKGRWSVEVTARDQESGLLQVKSQPRGIYFPNSYTSGTRDSIVGVYSDSCCHYNLQVSAVDRKNNRRSVDINPYHAKLSVGVICAIVFGILLLISVVAIGGYFIYKNRSRSYVLPRYKGGGI